MIVLTGSHQHAQARLHLVDITYSLCDLHAIARPVALWVLSLISNTLRLWNLH